MTELEKLVADSLREARKKSETDVLDIVANVLAYHVHHGVGVYRLDLKLSEELQAVIRRQLNANQKETD